MITGHQRITLQDGTTKAHKYILKSIALEGEDKNQKNFVAVAKRCYEEYGASRIIIESNN
nr:MAG TPA: hypothetical protein [Caudoviricetes sp.]